MIYVSPRHFGAVKLITSHHLYLGRAVAAGAASGLLAAPFRELRSSGWHAAFAVSLDRKSLETFRD